MKRNLREALQDVEPIVADGSVSTALYEKGYYINRSFEELSLTNPESVKQVTEAFKQAGSQILHTNTFGATLPRLTEYGIHGSMEEIIRASCQITFEVAKGEAWVVGSLGPLGIVLEPLGPTSFLEAQQIFKQSVVVLEQSGVDGFSLRSFHDLKEMEAAILAIREVSNKPILAHIAIQENQRTTYGHTLKEFVVFANQMNLELIGITGQIGPSGIFDAYEKMKLYTSLPMSLLPTAGLPRYVNDEYFYLANPDYMAKYAKRMVQAGAKIIGGSSGVHAVHIKAMTNSIRMLTPQKRVSQIVNIETNGNNKKIDVVPLEQRSLLGKRLQDGTKVYSVELTPIKGVDYDKFFERCKDLEEAEVEFVNIPDGARAMARMGSFHLASYIKKNFRLEPIPHLTGRDRNLLGLQADLMGAYVNGVRNLLLITGDPPKLGNCPDATAVYDVDAIGLTHIVANMNQGMDLGGSDFGKPTEYVIGVALNPTSHNQEIEAQRFKYKVEAGANYAITQPIYDLEAFSRFFEKFGAPKIPIVMGVWPLVNLRNAEFLKYEVPGVEIPDWIITEMEKAGDDGDEAVKRGIEIAIKTIEKAKSMVSGFQVNAPFNRARVALQVIKEVR